MSIVATYRAPLSLAPVKVAHHGRDLTVQQMAEAMDLPVEWWARGIVAVDGQVIPRHLWPVARPRPDAHEVRFLLRLTGGGGGGEGGKNPLAVLGSLFLLAATGFIAGGGLAPFLGQGFAAGTFGARLAGGVLAAAGSQALSRVGQRGTGGAPQAGSDLDAARVPTASMAGNVLDPDGTIPRVLGSRKAFPPLAAEPHTYFDGDDEVVEGVFVLSGPHELTDIRLGNALASDMTGVEIQTVEGWPGQAVQSLVRRQARTTDLGQELVPHRLQEDGITVDDSLGADWQPVGTVFTTRDGPEELWMGLVFNQGLNIEAVTDDRLRVPIRVRIRRLGTETWANLPELHFVGASLRPIRFTIKLKWSDSPDVEAAAPVADGFVEARIANPAQTNAPAGDAFDADASFVGSGDDYMIFSNLTSTAVENVQLYAREAVIYLDTADFPPDIYEVEVKRGAAVTSSDYDPATYEVDGTVWDLFGAQGTGTLQVVADQKKRVSTLGILRASSIWNENPIATDEFAQIAVRARNAAVGQLSTVASGYVRDWDGSAWASYTTTSNPAPHLRDVMRGRLNAKPVPEAVLDNDEIVAWRTLCAAKGYRINAIVDGGTVEDVLNRIAAAGFARPRRSNVWGVISEFDTSGDDPEFVFTERNSKGFSLRKQFPDPPSGIRASFADANRDYAERQIIIPPGAHGDLLARRYDDQVTEAEVIRAAQFELQELASRSASYVTTAPAEAIGMRRGDLTGVTRFMLDRHMGSGRVVDWAMDGSNLTEIRLDATVPVVNEPGIREVADIRAVTNIRNLGRKTYVAIRGEVAGAPVLTTHLLSNASGETDTLTLDTPASGAGAYDGALAAVGPASAVFRRMKVSDLRRLNEFQAEVTMVAEAPELVADH
ncbi:hypothetical protein HKCCE4037_06390 [Rhodobacterales bacterium HKCCE4037]|nr:hypothetical protein [Rhodobacterales bacterium HKCCE4037]